MPLIEVKFNRAVNRAAKDGTSFSYAEDTVLEMQVQPGVYHHTDRNTLKKV